MPAWLAESGAGSVTAVIIGSDTQKRSDTAVMLIDGAETQLAALRVRGSSVSPGGQAGGVAAAAWRERELGGGKGDPA